jgi:hypothetical protein
MNTPTTDPNAPAPTPADTAAFDRRAFLWKVLDRYDIYIGSTLSRTATTTALNTLLVGYIMLKSADILAAFGSHTTLRVLAFIGLGVGGLAAFASTLLSFFAVAPYLGRAGAKKDSLIFFEHVSARDKKAFATSINSLTEQQATEDIAAQVHDVATGLSGKFKWLKHASWTTLVALCAVLAIGAFVMISTWMDWPK